ncbi:MAG TPA: S53 family peptidase [Acidimicrobiales bacterium]|nr:S53 family peptidase [Acidimicrobiales bacterium]
MAAALAGSVVLGMGTMAVGGPDAGAVPGPATVPIAGSYLGAPAATELGPYTSADMGVEVVLAPSDRSAMNEELTALYDPSSPTYHHWMSRGVFSDRFAPAPTVRRSVGTFLRRAGLKVVASSSPFLVRAVGTSGQVAGAFSTTIDSYRAATGQTFFSEAAPVRVPASMAADVSGVVGLSDTAEELPLDVPTSSVESGAHYGAAPGGSGLTPSQLDGLYDAAPAVSAGPRGQGKGVTMAVFELSGYTSSDITTYARKFFGRKYSPRLVNMDVDGGPLTPRCPAGDVCHHKNDYGGDIEVDADLETQIAIAPRAGKILVYNAPNDTSGQTTVDEYMKIASDDLADSISTSWGLCEPDIGAAVAVAENQAFTQMAMQGQSITAAAGDDGAFDCLQDGTSNAHAISVDDPASQPLVTGVGGTSFEGFDPGSDLHPTYPAGVETVWNPLDACSGTKQGLAGCIRYGAGGGGTSSFWPRPSFQKGPGVQALQNREVPDVSANADEFTPYAEYCTGSPKTNSSCAFGGGWFGIGGTSLSSPLWAAVIGDATGFNGARFGTATLTLYPLFRSTYSTYFHDITGTGQTENSNGHYPVTPNYDMATGIGTPDIGALVTETGTTAQ